MTEDEYTCATCKHDGKNRSVCSECKEESKKGFPNPYWKRRPQWMVS